MDVVVALVFSFWLVLTLLCQGRGPFVQRLRRFDVLRLIPAWTFFAPNPATCDFHFLYRDWVRDEPTPWKEVRLGAPRRWYQALWHPKKYEKKVLTDLIQILNNDLSVMPPEARSKAICVTLPYITFLHLAASEPRLSERSNSTQFVLLSTKEAGPVRIPEVLLVSEVHPL